MGFDYRINDNKVVFVSDVIALINDEPTTLTSGTITRLQKKNIDINTIKVNEKTIQDGDGITYIEGTDYDVSMAGDFTQISRRPGGAIVNGSTVFVDYEYISKPAFDYSTFMQTYGIRFDLWSVLSLSYRLSIAQQKYRGGVQQDELLDDSIHYADAALNWKWSKTTISWEDKYTINAPLRKWTVVETLTFRPSDSIFLLLSGHYGQSDFKDTADSNRFSSINTRFQKGVGRRGLLNVEAFRNEITGSKENIVHTGFSSSFEWRYRIWTVTTTYTLFNEKDHKSGEDFKDQLVKFEISRILF
jgi:hypothetical protein